ncbi:MAG: hypothetical protein KC544_10535 [Gemmatimonadetes bacterium]|nr:hypothetical protein [Gemmatimonadota bacterium]
MSRRLLTGVILLAACGGEAASPAADAPPVVTVAERWISPADTAWDLDTPARWSRGDSGVVLVTGKASHDLRVFDIRTGAAQTPIGRRGAGPGEFDRPNAVLVAGDLALVVERDNHRVQVLRMPEATPTGSFGGDMLVKPYGAVIEGTLPELTIWVTDDYDVPADSTADLSRRVHRFVVRFDSLGAPSVVSHAVIGERSGPGALAVVETIGFDPTRQRLLVADEARKAYLVFDRDGHFLDSALADGMITGDPEGMALVGCEGSPGYWIVTDQQPTVSWFRVFRRDDLAYVGSFRGERTANTDGVTFAAAPVPGFAGSAFFAVHDDQAVSAFDWATVRDALGLDPGCR